MKHSGNQTSPSAQLVKRKQKFSSVTGTSATVATPDQLGINITKGIFNWKGANGAAMTAIDEYGLPFQFVVNGQQILLPPVVQGAGVPVPYLPDGLTVVYAQSFMGIPIPNDLFKPVSVGGKLRFDKMEMPSAQNAYTSMSGRAAGSWSNAVLINNGVDNGVNHGETLLYIVMAVFECLIYSYSSYPWGNGYNDLSGQVMTHRQYDNWLIYPLQKATFLGNIVNQVAPIYANTIAPIANAAGAALGIPGLGSATSAGLNAAAGATKSGGQPQTYGAGLTTQLAPSGTLVDPNGNILQQGAIPGSSPMMIIIILAIVVVVIILVIK